MSGEGTISAGEFERLGDEAVSKGANDEALACYDAAVEKLFELGFVATGDDDAAVTTAALVRISEKAMDVRLMLPPTTSPAEEAAELRAEADDAEASGHLVHAMNVRCRLGEVLEEQGDREAAESAYRQAVVLARQVDAHYPDLVLTAFGALIDFLAPSAESIALAQEVAASMLEREEMYHPMRAADAVYLWAVAELRFAEVTPNRVDHVIDGIVRQALAMLDDTCFHDKSQALQRRAAAVLRAVGRDSEAEEWQTEADKYEDWEWFMDQEIPGHVHLWDIRIA